ncbi:hypothetical protein ACFLTE_03315 [Bacteroidota bacterium]
MATKKAQTATKKPVAKKPAAKKTTPKKTASKVSNVSEGDIRKKAQKIYEERVKKGIPGNAESDWHKAEMELKGKK